MHVKSGQKGIKSGTKFHSEAETDRATCKIARCGPILRRFGPKTSAKGPKGDKKSDTKFHSEAEIQGAISRMCLCGATLSRFGFSTWAPKSGEKGQKGINVVVSQNSTLRPKFKAPVRECALLAPVSADLASRLGAQNRARRG